jgi:hypothetical protein
MPRPLNERFDELDDNLKLDPADRKRAEVAEIAAGVAKRTRLQGSFACKTMLPPLHDIDKIIELVDDIADELAGPGGPQKAMELIRQRVADRLPGATFEYKKHALGIVMPGQDFDFDAVPAFNEDDGTAWIRIADTEDDDWEPSNTYELIEVIAARNQACGGRFVRQVRMVKQAVRTAWIELPGLHIETFAYQAINSNLPHAQAVAKTLSTAASMLAGTYTEPTGVDRIDLRLTSSQKAGAQANMATLSARADDALRLAADGDEVGAAKIWSDIFGADVFPAPDEPGDFLRDLNRGIGGTSVGTPSPTTPRTRPWRL